MTFDLFFISTIFKKKSVRKGIENVVTINHSEGKVSRYVDTQILSYLYIMFCTRVLAGGEKNEVKFIKLTL